MTAPDGPCRLRTPQALRRSRGGLTVKRLTTKVDLAVDGRGLPSSIVLTPGNINDATAFGEVLDGIRDGIRWASATMATAVPAHVTRPSWSWLPRGDQAAAVGHRSRMRRAACMRPFVHAPAGPLQVPRSCGYSGVIAGNGDDRW
ncbi:transposase [Streptomyces anulatus]|uniref:transposase n=1 Tax=Streptomyces anulatus TaxID=1892 RepID=UPI003F4E0EA4